MVLWRILCAHVTIFGAKLQKSLKNECITFCFFCKKTQFFIEREFAGGESWWLRVCVLLLAKNIIRTP